jgi:3-isopropylmalate/(R)-2-methylmalate dehydratase small subunit
VQRSDGSMLECEPIPGFLLDLVEIGGLLPQLKRRLNPPRRRHEQA